MFILKATDLNNSNPSLPKAAAMALNMSIFSEMLALALSLALRFSGSEAGSEMSG